MTRRIGIFGGTFDPIHAGHILIAQEAFQKNDLNVVFFVPAGVPYQKGRRVSDKDHRWTMLNEALFEHRSWAQASRMELDREGDTYTIDTVRAFQELYPGDEIYLIIGEDIDIETWKDWHDLIQLCKPSRHERWLNLSSTMIRERIRRGLPVVPLIHHEVYEYIVDQDVYRPRTTDKPEGDVLERIKRRVTPIIQSPQVHLGNGRLPQSYCDRIWGEGGWEYHEGCPAAAEAGQDGCTHSIHFHRTKGEG